MTAANYWDYSPKTTCWRYKLTSSSWLKRHDEKNLVCCIHRRFGNLFLLLSGCCLLCNIPSLETLYCICKKRNRYEGNAPLVKGERVCALCMHKHARTYMCMKVYVCGSVLVSFTQSCSQRKLLGWHTSAIWGWGVAAAPSAPPPSCGCVWGRHVCVESPQELPVVDQCRFIFTRKLIWGGVEGYNDAWYNKRHKRDSTVVADNVKRALNVFEL